MAASCEEFARLDHHYEMRQAFAVGIDGTIAH